MEIIDFEDIGFGDRLKALLKSHKMSQRQLAELIKVPLKTLERWIQKDLIPPISVVYRMAVTLGVTSNYLLGGEEKAIYERRIIELAAREALSKVEDLARLILQETAKIKPLRK
ncbi:MAG: helix-turn-helix domain-containing protein [Treponema sp.]|nr:helix-turn-helix domain-containing protein [Treponema sp.]